MIIYKFTSPSGKSYIGQSKNSIEYRWNQHIKVWKRLSNRNPKTYKGNSVKFFYALDKYEPSLWTMEILCACVSKQDMNDKETYYIELFDTYYNGYNCTKGGEGRVVDFLEEEHKQNLSVARKEYFETDDGIKWKAELSDMYSGKGNPMFGKTFTHTEETKRNISERMKGKNIGKEPWNKGRTGVYSEETLSKMSANRIGKNIGKEPWNKSKTGLYEQTAKQKEAASKAKGKVWIITDPNGNEFEIFSLNKFCKENGLDGRNIQSPSGSKKYKARKK